MQDGNNKKQHPPYLEKELNEFLIIILQIDALHIHSELGNPCIPSFAVHRENLFSECYSFLEAKTLKTENVYLPVCFMEN